MSRLITYKKSIGFVVFFIIIIHNSCKKQENLNSGGANVEFNILGSEILDDHIPKKQSGVVKLKNKITGTSSDQDLEVTSTIEVVSDKKLSKSSFKKLSLDNGLKAVVETIAPGIKFSVSVFNSDGSYKSGVTYIVGEKKAPSLALEAGKTYTFVFTSYNDIYNSANGTGPTHFNNAQLTYSGSLDGLFYKTTVTLKEGVNRVDVLFKHLGSEVDVTLRTNFSTFSTLGDNRISPVYRIVYNVANETYNYIPVDKARLRLAAARPATNVAVILP